MPRLATRQTGTCGCQERGIVVIKVKDQLRGAAALTALEEAGKLWAIPAEVAAIMERDLKSVYAGLERGDIPSIRIGPRYQVSVAWLRRQANGVPDPQPVGGAA
jgi:hypothetical protein